MTDLEVALPARAAVKITSVEVDVTAFWHYPLNGEPKYLVIDVDNESDDSNTQMRIYRNDGVIYEEGF